MSGTRVSPPSLMEQMPLSRPACTYRLITRRRSAQMDQRCAGSPSHMKRQNTRSHVPISFETGGAAERLLSGLIRWHGCGKLEEYIVTSGRCQEPMTNIVFPDKPTTAYSTVTYIILWRERLTTEGPDQFRFEGSRERIWLAA